MSATLELAVDLLRRPSVTPEDAGCQAVLAARLAAVGFTVEPLRCGAVDNLWARHGTAAPLLVFAGHTDVVPPGPLELWESPPFAPAVREGWLYGRGAADMKGSLAAMLTAVERFLARQPAPRGSIGFLVTSDEEGDAIDGTVRVVERLQARGEQIDYCLIGEPTSAVELGDELKNGRRGSLHGRLCLHGVGGHVAYPHLVSNPIHAGGALISALAGEVWDRGDDDFPPTSLQITNIHAGDGTLNVVPATLELRCNFRFSPALTVEAIQDRVQHLVETRLLNEEVEHQRVYRYMLEWSLGGLPFLTRPGALAAATAAAVRAELGIAPRLSTGGGTSDGRFIAPTGAQVLELGPVNATIHKANERVRVADLDRLSRVYEQVLVRLLN